MSHLLNRSLHLHVGARVVQGTLHPAWSRGKVLARSYHVFGPSTLDIDVSVVEDDPEESFGDAVGAVISKLDSTASTRRAHLNVVLADSRVHYDVVSGDYGASSDRQLMAIANACIVEVLGDRAQQQIVRWQLQPDRRHLLISSIDTEEVETIVQAASRLQLRLNSLQPDLCSQWNQYSNRLPDGTGVFAVVCGSHLLAVYALKGSIIALTCCHCFADDVAGGLQARLHPIDEQVDRLLASIGQAAKDVPAFLLVVSDQSSCPITERWALIRAPEGSV